MKAITRRHEQRIGAGPGKNIEIAFRLDNHQVYIERLLRVASDRFDNHRSERDIRHEAAVHDVNMDPVGASRIDGTDLLGKMPEIRRQDRRCNNNRLQNFLELGCHNHSPFEAPGAAAFPEVDS